MEYKLVGEEELLRRYVTHASETAVQDLLAASQPELQDGWRLFRIKRGVEICRKNQGRVKVVRGQCIVDVSASEFQSLTSVVDTCKVRTDFITNSILCTLECNSLTCSST